jgi:hypothetical protein
MPEAAVQLDQDALFGVPDVVELSALVARQLPDPRRQTMGALHVAHVPDLHRAFRAVGHIGQNQLEQLPFRMPGPQRQSTVQRGLRREPPLEGARPSTANVSSIEADALTSRMVSSTMLRHGQRSSST